MPGLPPPDWWTPEAKAEWWKLEKEYWELEKQKLALRREFYGDAQKRMQAAITRPSPTAEAADLKSAQSGFESQGRDHPLEDARDKTEHGILSILGRLRKRIHLWISN
jgi:hypothetical protein